MALKTRAEYLSSLKKLRPNIYKFGERIEDVTAHPATRRVVESHARAYDAAHDPALSGLFTATSYLTGEKIHRQNSLMQSAEEVISNSKFKTGDVPADRDLHRSAVRGMERDEHHVGHHPRDGQGFGHGLPPADQELCTPG